jgi:GR25 family glycosyltransferase involved in LPS biosynthesis
MAFYINLDRRIDRRNEIEGEFAKMNMKVERFPAIEHSSPPVGCGLSHIAVLKLARERGYESVMVFEDDFMFLISKNEWDTLLRELPSPYDVVMTCSGIVKPGVYYNEIFDRVQDAQQTAGYIVHSRFYDRLIARFEEGVQKFMEHPHMHWVYSIDMYWKPLQRESDWFSFRTKIGRQRPGFSDLTNTFVEYDY